MTSCRPQSHGFRRVLRLVAVVSRGALRLALLPPGRAPLFASHFAAIARDALTLLLVIVPGIEAGAGHDQGKTL
jgi:hypothetical protein